jgi:hypothetical protein
MQKYKQRTDFLFEKFIQWWAMPNPILIPCREIVGCVLPTKACGHQPPFEQTCQLESLN